MICDTCAPKIQALVEALQEFLEPEMCEYRGTLCYTHAQRKPCAHDTARKAIEFAEGEA